MTKRLTISTTALTVITGIVALVILNIFVQLRWTEAQLKHAELRHNTFQVNWDTAIGEIYDCNDRTDEAILAYLGCVDDRRIVIEECLGMAETPRDEARDAYHEHLEDDTGTDAELEDGTGTDEDTDEGTDTCD